MFFTMSLKFLGKGVSGVENEKLGFQRSIQPARGEGRRAKEKKNTHQLVRGTWSHHQECFAPMTSNDPHTRAQST
jgi:hypothetical protein